MGRSVSPHDRYASLGASFSARGDVSQADKKGFGSAALTMEGRIFAMLTRGRLVIKLPKVRVEALVKDGWGVRFDANRGVEMNKEWLTVDPAHDADWTGLAEEAFAFVQRSGRGRPK